MQEVFQNEGINHIHLINRINFNKFIFCKCSRGAESAPGYAVNEAITIVDSLVGGYFYRSPKRIGIRRCKSKIKLYILFNALQGTVVKTLLFSAFFHSDTFNI